MAKLRIGSRGSQLALWQANHIAALLRAAGHEVEIEVIKTTGDRVLDVSLAKVGTKGMFTQELEDALAQGAIDLAVHSLKDMPTEMTAGFELAAITEREDPRDAFVSLRYNSFASLPESAVVGTSSLRRQAQIKASRFDVKVKDLRGNVDTRLKKLEDGDYDAIILAAAGLKRINRTHWIREHFTPETICPAAGQGALAIEVREGDADLRSQLAFLDDKYARTTTTAERALLRALGGGCQVPIGAHAEIVGNYIHLRGVVARPDGARLLHEIDSGAEPEELGQRVGKALLRKGAQRILDEVYGSEAPAPQQP